MATSKTRCKPPLLPTSPTPGGGLASSSADVSAPSSLEMLVETCSASVPAGEWVGEIIHVPINHAKCHALEMRAASIECEGFLYATIDFTPPSTICSASAEVPRSYDGKRCTDDVVLVWNNLPNGWKQCPSDFSDTVREKVIKPYQWGTHLLVMEDGKAYRTPGCGSRDEPGEQSNRGLRNTGIFRLVKHPE
eukprot:g13453.t1